MLQQGGRPMHVKPTFAALGDRKILQDLGLQRRAQALCLLDAVILRRGFQIRKRGETKVLVQPQHFSGRSPGTVSISSTPAGTSLRSFSRMG